MPQSATAPQLTRENLYLAALLALEQAGDFVSANMRSRKRGGGSPGFGKVATEYAELSLRLFQASTSTLPPVVTS